MTRVWSWVDVVVSGTGTDNVKRQTDLSTCPTITGNGQMDRLVSGFINSANIDLQNVFEERAAIMEYDGGLTRPEAEHMARRVMDMVTAYLTGS